jgi:hypothetical protein
MEKIESAATEIEETGNNYLQLFLYRAPKRNHDADAAEHNNSKITLSLNDFTDSVSKRILQNLLGASSNIEPMNFLHHVLLQQSVHGISDPTQNNRLC